MNLLHIINSTNPICQLGIWDKFIMHDCMQRLYDGIYCGSYSVISQRLCIMTRTYLEIFRPLYRIPPVGINIISLRYKRLFSTNKSTSSDISVILISIAYFFISVILPSNEIDPFFCLIYDSNCAHIYEVHPFEFARLNMNTFFVLIIYEQIF